jgi:hypothetical protein
VRVAVREHDDFTGFECDRLLADDAAKAAAFGDRMIGDQPVGARKDLGQHRCLRRLLGRPGRAGGNPEKHGVGQTHRAQQIGQNVARHFRAPAYDAQG